MSVFNIGLSGLNGTARDLDVTSNNIANAETVGFKRSRAEFADLYASNAFGNSRTQAGSGVNVQSVSQQFGQGSLKFTDNALDLAIGGQGFFVLHPSMTSTVPLYTRAGAFQVNADGYVTTATGQYLQGFPVNPKDGKVTTGGLANTQSIQLPRTAKAPNATTAANLSVNLDARDTQPLESDGITPIPFDITDPNSYNASTSVNVYDSLGTQHTANYYFVKDAAATPQTWQVYAAIDGYTDQGATANQPTDGSAVAITPGVLTFDSNGQLDTTALTPPNISWTAIPGAADLIFDTGFGANAIEGLISTTQFSQAFAVQGLSQDGYAPGQLTGVNVSDTGVVFAQYSNGQSTALAKVALADFTNPQGLRQLGDTNWSESLASGPAIAGEAGTGVLGSIKSGALEQSNVDLTSELVHLIVAQRNFQANAKSIETASQITDTIINLR